MAKQWCPLQREAQRLKGAIGENERHAVQMLRMELRMKFPAGCLELSASREASRYYESRKQTLDVFRKILE